MAAGRRAGKDRGLALVTRPQLALAFGVHAITISKWEAHDGLPVEAPGGPGKPSRYSLPKCIAWALERERAKHQGTGGLDLDAERAKFAAAQRERVQLQNAVRRGELVEVEAVTAVWGELLATVRASLLAMPASLAPMIATLQGGARAVEALLRDRIEGALQELATWTPPEQGGPA